MVSWLQVVSLALMLLGSGRRFRVSCMFQGENDHQFPLDLHVSSSSTPSSAVSQVDSWDSDDESWWEGAEEIDLTLPADALSEEYLVQDVLSNESCIWNLDCEEFMVLRSIPPPNGILDLPPPPLPPFLSGLKRIMMDSDPGWKLYDEDYLHLEDDYTGVEEGEGSVDGERHLWRLEQDQCSLCRWATGGNKTLYMFSRLAESDAALAGSLVGLLVGVGLASALIGATVMGTLLRCRKMKMLPKGSDPCSYLMRKSWTKAVARNDPADASSSNDPNTQRNKDNGQGTTNHTGWAMKLWRRSSSQAPLNLCSSPENSYSEEPYVNADATSSLYAELNSLSSPHSENNIGANMPNTYSEIPDPVKLLEMSMCARSSTIQDGGLYENAGYILSEVASDPNESSTGSTSTPSSAYYSDISSGEVYNNKKKRKKKKGNEKVPNVCNNFTNKTALMSCSTLPSPNVPVVSGRVPYHPVHLNFAADRPRGLNMKEPLSLSLQVLPKNLYHAKKCFDPNVQNILNRADGVLNNARDLNSTLPNGRFVPSVMNYGDICLTNANAIRSNNCTSSCVQNVPNVQSLSTLTNFYNDRNKNHCSDLCFSNSLCHAGQQRPLPPLPSRMITGPQRKHPNPPTSHVSPDNGVPAVPSEYV